MHESRPLLSGVPIPEWGTYPRFNTPSGQNQNNNSMDSPLKPDGIVHQLQGLFEFNTLACVCSLYVIPLFGGGCFLSQKSVGVGFLYFPFPVQLTSLPLSPPPYLFTRAESGTCMPKSSPPLRTCSWMGKIHVSCFSPGVACGSRATSSSEFDSPLARIGRVRFA